MTAPETREAGDASHASLNAEQRRIERGSRLHWLHWAVIALSTVLTLLAWRFSSMALEARAELRFDGYARQAIELFTEKLESHADVLRASAGFVAASEHVSPDEWQRYTDALAIAEQFPAITGLGVIYRIPRRHGPAFLDEQRMTRPDFRFFPEHTETVHFPLTLLSPRHLVDRLTGFDLAHEPRRRDAISRALERGAVQITEPIELANQGGPGFVMVAPFPGGDRRSVGTTVASMRVVDLANGALDQHKRQVAIRVSDGGRTLYDETTVAAADTEPAPHRSMSRALPLYGREWLFEVRSTPAFHDASNGAVPRFTLLGGLLLDTLLLVLFTSFSRANRRCLSFADRTSAALRANQTALQVCNEELEAFAHVVSHDLKTPLNGVTYLAEFIEEDLDDCECDAGARDRMAANVKRLKWQASRGRALIGGVLDYSQAATTAVPTERVDVRALLEDAGEAMALDDGQLALAPDLPVLETHRIRLEQVLTNLVSNAVKYHDDRPRLRIEVSVERPDARTVRFRVGDNGPGIEERHHARIFELFGRLEHAEEVDSTGVGLSIVKRTVEHLGGAISIESTPGGGATFVFDWPAYPMALDTLSKAA